MAIFQFNLIPPFGIPSFTATKIYYGSQDFLVLKSAHKLSKKLTEVRKNGTLPYLQPDGKTQVSVEYDENRKPKRLGKA